MSTLKLAFILTIFLSAIIGIDEAMGDAVEDWARAQVVGVEQ